MGMALIFASSVVEYMRTFSTSNGHLEVSRTSREPLALGGQLLVLVFYPRELGVERGDLLLRQTVYFRLVVHEKRRFACHKGSA